MSDLQKSFARTHLSRLSQDPPPLPEEREEDDTDEISDIRPTSADDSSSSASSVSSTGTIVPSPSRNLFERPKGSTTKSRSAPLPWNDFFSQELYFNNNIEPSLIHHAYLTPASSNGPLIVTHHGAGSSGLSFATFFSELQKSIPNAGILSLDARGHGSTQTSTSIQQHLDLTLSTLATDLAFVVECTRIKLHWSKLPDVILLGHSLGGAVVTEVAHKRLLGSAVLGYGVLDVVEGSAIDALQSMEHYLLTRPKSFASLSSGIEWHIKSRTLRNTNSARVSVPPLLVASENGPQWLWRTDLAATKPFWENWFVGLSKKFLEARGGKLLILAGTDRLDKELMIGQMQGKYQLQVFPEAGHFVHEDQPAKTATVVADFYKRNDRSSLILPPKVDDLIKQGKLKTGGLK